jgi:putative MATE family efflux protein
MDARTRLLLEAPLGRTILRLAAPNVLVMLAQASIGLIETYFVAKLGVDSLAGIALVFPLFMLLQMVSAGAMGGGILSAVARALGARDLDRANRLVWSAVVITLVLAAATTLLAWTGGPWLYSLLGGRGTSLSAATTYSAIVFAGAVPLWMFNSFAAVIRGTGNMIFPATVICVGAVILIPLSPMLIFGLGPVPALGIAGGATAVLVYYVIGCVVLAAYIWSGRGVLKPRVVPPRLAWAPVKDILRVGAASSIVSVSTNMSIVTATGLAGLLGPDAVAGYGTGARLEYLLVPLVFGLGAPVAAMTGTAVGAQNFERATRAAWTGALIAGLLTEAVGLVAAVSPSAWLGLFGHDPQMIAVGSSYLRIVGPFYGFFGAGLALYFASQGAGRLRWPIIAAMVRVAVAAVGGWLAVEVTGCIEFLFVAVGLALAIFGILNTLAVASGAWLPRRKGTPEISAAVAKPA